MKENLAFLGVLALSAAFALLACIGLWTVIGWVVTGNMLW